MERLLCFLMLSVIVACTSARMCPDGSTCTDESTCCEVDGGRNGCCPLVNAVCCDDKEHCCPNGYTCSEGFCFKADQNVKLNVSTDCPGGQYVCPEDNTCCPYEESFTCCPLPDATCCSDGLYCCPGGTTCDLAHQTCNVPIAKIASTTSRRSKVGVVVCPGGEFQCPDDSTCCLPETGDYGCCPLPNTVCCDDKVHCCPSGYTCNGGRCSQLATPTPIPIVITRATPTPIVDNDISQSRATPTPIVDNDISQSRATPTPIVDNDISQSRATPTPIVDNDISQSGAVPASLTVPAFNGSMADMNVCADGSACPDQMTCFPMAGGQYGCCPTPQATFCSDLEHCCPNEYQCQGTQCVRSGENGLQVVPWLTKVPATRSNSICPDFSFCPLFEPCCHSSSGYRCCPFFLGNCCADGMYCCASGYRCTALDQCIPNIR